MFAKILKPTLFAALATAPVAAVLTTQPATPAFPSPMSGVWEVTGTPNASSGVLPFVNICTIAVDGTMSNVDPEVGAGVGEVVRSGSDFTVGFFGYFDAAVPAQYEVQATTTLGPHNDTFSGPFRTVIRDLGGNVLTTYEGTVSATRLSAQAY